MKKEDYDHQLYSIANDMKSLFVDRAVCLVDPNGNVNGMEVINFALGAHMTSLFNAIHSLKQVSKSTEFVLIIDSILAEIEEKIKSLSFVKNASFEYKSHH